MSKVVAIMSMSLDGYVADLNDGVGEVFDWYVNSGDVEIHTGGSDPMTFKVSAPSAEHIRSLTSGLGAVLTGRRTFDVAHGWNGNHAWGPAFVLTHRVPAGWPRPNSTVHFVLDGIESAVNQAKNAAAGKNVGVHGADTIRQLLNAGLLDEISVDIAAVLLGSGVRLFDSLAGTPVVLGNPTVVQVSASHTCATRYARRFRLPRFTVGDIPSRHRRGSLGHALASEYTHEISLRRH
jgi:dihydrofolate reductase